MSQSSTTTTTTTTSVIRPRVPSANNHIWEDMIKTEQALLTDDPLDEVFKSPDSQDSIEDKDHPLSKCTCFSCEQVDWYSVPVDRKVTLCRKCHNHKTETIQAEQAHLSKPLKHSCSGACLSYDECPAPLYALKLHNEAWQKEKDRRRAEREQARKEKNDAKEKQVLERKEKKKGKIPKDQKLLEDMLEQGFDPSKYNGGPEFFEAALDAYKSLEQDRLLSLLSTVQQKNIKTAALDDGDGSVAKPKRRRSSIGDADYTDDRPLKFSKVIPTRGANDSKLKSSNVIILSDDEQPAEETESLESVREKLEACRVEQERLQRKAEQLEEIDRRAKELALQIIREAPQADRALLSEAFREYLVKLK